MIKIQGSSRPVFWPIAVMTLGLLAACGGGGGGRDPILGAGANGSGTGSGVIPGAPGNAVPPGNSCSTAPSPSIPTVTSSDPSNGNLAASTSTTGVNNNGKAISASFSLPMNPATLDSTTFTVAPTGGTVLLPTTVVYSAAAQTAVLTTSSALQPSTRYTAIITQSVKDAAGTPLACNFAWSFTTAAAPLASLSPANLGRASSFGVAATAGVTSTATAPSTQINGDVVLDPTATCNAVAVDNVGGFGQCGNYAPTISGKVITPTYPDTTTADSVRADLRAAYLSITPPSGPPAAGSLGGGTPIAAPTTLGAVSGSAAVPGQNVFFPGVYTSITSILISNDLTLDAQGNADAVFIFQSSSTIGTAAGAPAPGVHTRILLANGAKASNVFWQAGSSATLGTQSEFQGNLFAGADITMNTGATSCGRLFAGAFTSGAFVFDSNTVSVPGSPNAPTACK